MRDEPPDSRNSGLTHAPEIAPAPFALVLVLRSRARAPKHAQELDSDK
jgi:hypothetical protein